MDLTGRADSLAALAEREFDLLVIGGGVIGAGVASVAARHGLAVALVEQGRLRRCDLELVVEADPRRAAVPAPRRRPPRA